MWVVGKIFDIVSQDDTLWLIDMQDYEGSTAPGLKGFLQPFIQIHSMKQEARTVSLDNIGQLAKIVS